MVEMVAEGDDTLMEKFFSQGTLEEADLLPGLRHEIAARKVFPVFCASSSQQIGVRRILDACVDLFPSPEGTKVEGTGKDGKLGIVDARYVTDENPFGMNPDDPDGQGLVRWYHWNEQTGEVLGAVVKVVQVAVVVESSASSEELHGLVR